MIISASRRTDIPAFYGAWFLQRLEKGFFMYKNPMNAKQVIRLNVNPQNVDCFVFWTKNPESFLKRLDKIESLGYDKYYFQYTLNDYEKEIERNLPELGRRIDAFETISKRIGSKRIIWRYDPIILGERYDEAYHAKRFTSLAQKLEGSTERCIVSFLDDYISMRSNLRNAGITLPVCDPTRDGERMARLAEKLFAIAQKYRIELRACAEPVLAAVPTIKKAACVDVDLISEINPFRRYKSQRTYMRKECNCFQSYDIGAANTCRNGCLYCYSTDMKKAEENAEICDSKNVLLTGQLTGEEVIYVKDE